jgi:hypothetical protein
MKLLQEFCKGVLIVGCTTHISHKKWAFRWTKEVQKTFDRMKEVMSTFLVLALPDFTQPFVLECDASK